MFTDSFTLCTFTLLPDTILGVVCHPDSSGDQIVTKTKRTEVLKIRCSDGRSRKPGDIRDKWVHEIRLPGGILFPNLCAQSFLERCEQTFEMSALVDDEIQSRFHILIESITPETGLVIGEIIVLLAIKTMMDLKQVEEIILVYHTHCGAGDALGLKESDIYDICLKWQFLLCKLYPVRIRILKEEHSVCGEHHFGHSELNQSYPEVA